jgi:hypothetical protein
MLTTKCCHTYTMAQVQILTIDSKYRTELADLGTSFSCTTCYRTQGKVEIIPNGHGSRKTPLFSKKIYTYAKGLMPISGAERKQIRRQVAVDVVSAGW